MMGIGQLALVVLLKEVGGVDPEKLPFVLSDELSPARDLLADESHHGLGLALAIRDQQDDVAVFRTGRAADSCHLILREELIDRAAGEPGHTLSPRTLGDGDQLVQVAARHVPTARNPQPANHAAGVERTAEDLRLRVSQHMAEVGDLEVVAKVRLVAAKPQERLLDVEARKWSRQLDSEHVAPQFAKERLDQSEDVFLVAEGHLEVQLGELGLSIGSQVLIAEAAGDLVVALNA